MSASRALFTLLFLCLLLPFTSAQQQDQPTPTASSSSTTATATATATRSVAPVQDATATPVALNDSAIVRTRLDVDSTSGAFFTFNIPASVLAQDDPVEAWLSLSICSGPAIPAYNSSNSTLLEQLGLSATEAQRATLVRVYVSDDPEIQRPGPSDADKISSRRIGYAQGGWTSLELDISKKDDASDQTLYIGVWPPADTREEPTDGSYVLQLVVSTRAKMESVDYSVRPRLDDTDATAALVTSFNYTAPAPNISAVILPTFGQYSLPSAAYFNSSFCAISDAWSDLQASNQAVRVNSSETQRMTSFTDGDDMRMQFEIQGLQRDTNYTLWLVEAQPVNEDVTLGLTYTLFPAIKLVTKRNDNCRLVYDVPFCPEVAYSIPVSPEVSTQDALSVISETVSPNYSNFSTMIDTFPCGDPYFGAYSVVATCAGCKKAYQDWLCSVAMPRCTDTISSSNDSRASQDGRDLTGRPTGLNVDHLPYIVNREGGNSSRREYIDTDLRAGDYGEVLPCIYNCYFVERMCPPFIAWSCPVWDVTAQRDYGTFADSGPEGIGAAENGDAGPDGQNWGGPQRYVATDGFGHTFCNSVGVEYLLRVTNSATSLRLPVAMVLMIPVVAALYLLT